jgi:Ser-tRNA(Ala) deacylase AlaX
LYRIQDSLAIGVTDERMVYAPSYYTDTGYVHDLFLMSERRGFRKGDTVGYGIDWERKQQFIMLHGVRGMSSLECFTLDPTARF